MEGAVLAGEALADDLGILVDEDAHCSASLAPTAPTRSPNMQSTNPGMIAMVTPTMLKA
jgi:hypothetical protein